MARALSAGTTTCSGLYTGSGKEVTVPAGAVCTLLAGTKVSENVQVQKGGALIDQGAVIGKNVTANNATSIQVGGGSIGGNLQVVGLTAAPAAANNSLCDTIVKGNVEVLNNGAHSPVDIGDLGACKGGPGSDGRQEPAGQGQRGQRHGRRQ